MNDIYLIKLAEALTGLYHARFNLHRKKLPCALAYALRGLLKTN
jgi:hypothetical protein